MLLDLSQFIVSNINFFYLYLCTIKVINNQKNTLGYMKKWM